MEFICTSDVHGFHLGSLEYLKDRDINTSILIDNGDFFIGSTQATYYNHLAGNNKLVALANNTGYDVMIPGNHDFDYGLDFYQKIVSQLHMPVICCNIFNNQEELIFKPYVIIEKNNQKIGIIGAMTSNLSQLTSFDNTKDMRCESAVYWINHYVEELRPLVDTLVVSYHGGVECDLVTGKPTQYQTKEDQAYEIASSIKGIDLLFCGHQHRQNQGVVNDTLLVQVPQHLKEVASVENKNLTWKSIPQESIEDESYEAWLRSPIDLTRLEDWVSKYFKADYISLDLIGNTILDLKESLSQIYPIRVYEYSYDDCLKFDWFQSDKIEDSYQIATNRILDDYRLIATSVTNVFDLYYHSIAK